MMVTTPNVIVAGHPDLARRLRGTGRFPAVFDAASASGLRDLSKSGEVRAPAAFLFAPDFDEDLPGAGVPFLADRLAASGHTVVVHGFFTERGDVFAPEVIATAKPLTLKELLELLGAARPESPPSPGGTTFTWPSDGPPPELRVSAAEAPAGIGAGAAGARANDSSSLIPGYGGLSMLHRGTGSVTYRAVREDSGAVAAVRVRLDGSETPMDELAALERASRSDHLVSVLESGRATTGQLYTAAVYCPGGAPAPAPMPLGDAVRCAISTGWALQALHDEGLVHGDVRPGRILRGEAGPLLTGAATARGLAAHAAHGVLEPVARERVNPAFAPPEALRQEPQTAQSDVYGLGATLWGLLAGRAPFAADGQRAPDGAVARVPRDDVPEWLANALGTALANEPADRYPTAREFAEALEEGLRAAPPQDGRVAGAPSAPWDTSAPEPDPAPVAASEQPATIVDQELHFAEPPAPATTHQAPYANQQAPYAEPQAPFGAPQAPYAEPQAPFGGPQIPFGGPQAPFTNQQAPFGEGHAQPSYQHVPFEEPQAPLTDFADQPLHFAEPQGPFTQQEAAPARSNRPRIVLLALLGLVLAAIVFSAVSLLTGSGSAERRGADSPPASNPASPAPASPAPASSAPGSGSPAPTSSPTAVRPETRYSPSQVRIVDGRVSIEISWKDATGGKAAYYVVGGPVGRTPSTMANVPAGTAKATILALNPGVDYCLTVVAVLDVDRVAYAKPICTHRGKRAG
ncbi:Serine/threonine protein kinase [Actinomadura glauciflava]|uniref:protein kinase domain-containing protein n=1 Tax=Actinomadura luteofluorescens TaxID=46163 RepID=UPI0021642019|nr:protein kinase [Actinomadura glauciflava]MCR3744560.1 Serine/threonine protein kinase [Actinomadura glauciflava]